MRRRSHRGQDSAEVNMTPMLDIVFILLIFFIVTATFLQEQGVQMIAPPSDEDQQPTDTPSILVQIDERNTVFVNGEITDLTRVAARIQRKMVDTGGQAAVIIQPDPNALHRVVTVVHNQAGEAGAAGVVVRKPE